MRTSVGVRALGDQELLATVSRLAGHRNQITAQFLEHLAELDERQLFLGLGFCSLFDYCVKQLNLAESTVWKQIAVARLCRRLPAALAMVDAGEAHVSALSLIAKHLNPENAGELLEVCRRRSTRQVERELAARFPKAEWRDAAEPLAVGSTLDVESSGRVEALAADRFGVRFTADEQFCELIERVRGLAAHRLPKGDLLSVMRNALEVYERELKKERFGVGRKARARRVSGRRVRARARAHRTREHIAAEVTRAVVERDGLGCTFVSEDGRRCGSCWMLELEHVEPWAAGGGDTAENLTLRCRAHHQWAARSWLGKTWKGFKNTWAA